ncbi:MAG: extracellular solute-binding protein [Bifidobacteriaceae bacterium]|jgi:ABC-type glycerol-3-phosphate transport system substrate-binding protein|nr:extracellular solute-binding protein [Bifidobacteriaceae bacterium]
MRKGTAKPIIALAALALATSLAACGNDKKDDEGGGSADSGEVTWWSWTPDTPVAEKYIAEFNKVYPDIKIKFTNYENADYAPAMSTAFQTGSGPDIFAIGAGGNVGGKQLWGDYAADLAPAAEEALGADWKDKFAPGYVDQLTWDGKIAALPLGGVAADFFWINKDLFDANGVSTELKTYAELKAACDTFAAAGVQCFTMGTNSTDTFSTELFRTITTSIDPDYYLRALHGEASWDDPVAIEALDIVRKMQADGIIAQDATSIKQYPESNNNFMSQKAAIVQMGTWYAQYAAKDSMINSMEGAGVSNPTPFTMLPMRSPDFAGKGNIPQYIGEADYGLSINAESKNFEAAKTFVFWLTATLEGQQVVANAIDLVPAFIGVEADWDSLGLVTPEIQIPAFKTLYADAAAATESRNLYISAETGNAQVIAMQQVLADPNLSTADIAAQMEADSVDSPAE